jgi:Uma2 family endonuclease
MVQMSAMIDRQTSLYEQLLALPENIVGEIINGQLRTQPRPAGPHALAGSALGGEIYGPYHKGRGGPGGWWILDEPEIHFIRDVEVLVPDIAGWRRERLSRIPAEHRFEVAPDWVCEVLSPSTAKIDRIEKMPVYARYTVAYLWLLDPLARTLEVFTLQDGHWLVWGLYQDNAEVSAPPFQEITLSLADLWVEM